MAIKTVLLDLVGMDGNAFSIMGAFQHQAKKEGWTQEEIKDVLNAVSGSRTGKREGREE